MILINKGETKKVVFYLTPTLSPIYYLFQFISNDTANITLMMSNNTSTTTQFQSFTFSEGSSATQSGGFTLNPGSYDYEIYQSIYPLY